MKTPQNISRSDVVVAIYEWVIGRNAERNRQILMRSLVDGITYEKLAEEFDLTDRQVKNIVYKYRDKVFMHIHRH